MIAIFTLLITLILSLLVTRIGAMALALTGLSDETAKFQARSAYSGVGFTTSEAEIITNHPVRRRIVYTLMLLGNIGLATVTASTIASILQADSETDANRQLMRMGILAGGLVALWFVANSRWVERQHNKVIAWALKKFTRLKVQDYIAVLNLQNGYSVFEIQLNESNWLTGRSLRDLRLTDEGILVLGIQRKNGTFLGAPNAETSTAEGDTLVLYGLTDRLVELDHRQAGRAGEEAHRKSIEQHRSELRQQKHLDPEDPEA